ncbi:YuzL family protein [Anoxybacillus sp. PDR2]|nr:hypothetical protein [Anoxybacillus rupiensis]MBS2772370.1 YuzL family protein [Anoxybacillus rupiensis]QHC03988.1 YuzL family protein [Anoxybacillus sp. PDR2]
MSKRKKDSSKTGLSSPHIQGQGTTTTETGAHELDSARKKNNSAIDRKVERSNNTADRNVFVINGGLFGLLFMLNRGNSKLPTVEIYPNSHENKNSQGSLRVFTSQQNSYKCNKQSSASLVRKKSHSFLSYPFYSRVIKLCYTGIVKSFVSEYSLYS